MNSDKKVAWKVDGKVNWVAIRPWFGLLSRLILGVAIRPMAIATAALMLLFIAAITQAGLRGLSIDCGCFGGGGAVEPGETKYLQEIGRDFVFFLLAGYLYKYPVTKWALERNQ